MPHVRALADGGYEQIFTAGYMSSAVEHGVITIGLTEEKSAPVHGLIISIPQDEQFSPSDVYMEFNDQGSACTGSEVTLTHAENRLILEYSDGAQVWAGRISYSTDADPFRERDENYEFPLRRVVVELQLPIEDIQSLSHELERLKRNGVRVGRLSNST